MPAMRFLSLLLLLALAACVDVTTHRDDAPEMTRAAGWRWETIPAGAFDLAVAVAPRLSSNVLTVYLEGDGFAYVRANQPALDPTPTDPVALRLALADPTGGAAWISRPCQYAQARGCNASYWTSARYAPEIVDSVMIAIDTLKRRSGSSRLVLVGYSGGGAVAMLIAARRSDVAQVITVAANLDVGYWTERDGLAPLTGSLDPVQYAPQLGSLPQLHLTGAADRTVGTDVVRAFVSHLPRNNAAQVVELPDFNHTCCWARDWPALYSRFNIGKFAQRG